MEIKRTFSWILSFLTMGIVLGIHISVWGQSATLTGTVIDEKTEQPIAGAKVELSNANAGTGYFVTHTGADGRFSFTQVRSGLYYDLGVLAEGYCPYEMQSWSVPENQNAVEMKIPLIQGSRIHGKVTASDGQTPLANAQVMLTYESGDFQMINSEQSLFSDKEGNFNFPQIPPNQYRLSISLGGYIGEQIVGIRPQPGDEKNFSVKLYKPGNISGTVMLEENRSPLPNIEISARGASQRTGTSDENGFFTIGSLKPGSYPLTCSPSGFRPYQSSSVIQLEEGQSVSNAEVHLKPLPPAMVVSVRREVFLPDQDLVFQIRTFRIGQYDCAIHTIPASVFLSEESNVQSLTDKADLSPFALAKQWQEDVEFDNPYVWIDKNVKIPEKLSPGAYIFRIASPSDNTESRVLFFVTQFGIVVKRGEKKTFIYATDLKTSMPIQDAKVRIVHHSNNIDNMPGWTETFLSKPLEQFVWQGETDVNGIAVLEHDVPPGFTHVVAVSPAGHIAVSPMNESSLVHSQSNTIYTYTDRPVYRPGQTVYYKAIFREKEERDYRIPTNENAHVNVKDPENKDIFEIDQTTNDWGSIHGSFQLASDCPLGQYRLFAKTEGGVENSMYFYVEEYRKPEFKVDVEPEKPFYINGDTLAFSVRSEYYFGAPVPNADVKYRIYESFATGGESHDYPSSYTSFLTNGESRTDAEGITRIEFVPERSSRDRRISIEVDITEASGRRVSGSSSVPVGVGSFYITAKPVLYVFQRENPLGVEIQTRTHDDKIVSATVNVEYIQEVWNPVRRRYERPSRPQAVRTGHTDEKGNCTLEWLPDSDISGRIDVMVSSQDENGNLITASTQLWRMAFAAGSFDLQYPTLEGILNKDSYQPGEEATLLINTNFPENPVILTIEGRDILFYRVIWPAGKTTAVQIPVLPEYAPNVYVSIFMPRETNLSTRTYDLNVPVQRGDLNIEIQSDREKYKPGEKGIVQIKTTLPDGSPVASEVSLAIVDEAIFAIRSDHTPNIHSIFYDRQSNWVVTTFSYPLNYYGGADKGVQPDLRKDFRDTALWAPNIYTDANGIGSVEVTYPDNLTTWRFTARGHTKNTDVGWKRPKTLVTKDIVARVSLPRFFVESDQVMIPSLVNNLSDVNLPDIQTKMTVEGGVNLKEADSRTTQAAAGAVARESWNVAVTAATPTASFIFDARSQTDQDALQLVVPVLPLGYRDILYQSAKIDNASLSIPVTLENNILLHQSKMTFSITPSLAAVALGAIPYLTDFPYGCVEQTLNGFLPHLLLLHTLNDLGALSPEDQAKLENLAPKIERSLSRLYSMQRYEGGWGWFGNSMEDLMLTALVVHGLDQTRKLGYSIDEDRLNHGIEYLKNYLSSSRVWDTQAYVTYVLSEVSDDEPPMLNELYVNRNELYDYGLAVSALAFHHRQKEKEANEILDLLLSRLTSLSDRHAAWETSPDRMWSWNGTSAETTAWGLKALVSIRGVSEPVNRIVQWMIDQRWGQQWRSTRETAANVEALRTVIQSEAQNESLTDLTYNVLVNQKSIQQGSIAKDQFTKPFVVDLPLQIGTNEIHLDLNRAQGFWSLNSSLFKHGEILKPRNHAEFKITRLFERAIHTRDYRGRPKIMTEGFTAQDALNVGQEILVTVIINAKRDLPYMIVEDPLPSGCEVIESFLSQTDQYWVPFSHYERRDQKMVFFLDNVPKGETRIEYLMRAELQGTFHANPTHAWCMYYPDYSAFSAGNRMQVK